MAAKIKKPSGLSISRDGSTYHFTWKNHGEYANGVDLQYKSDWGKWSKTINIAKNKTSYALKGAVRRQVKFRVRGDKKGKSDTAWATSSEYRLAVPNDPSVTASLTSPNVTKFTSSVEVNEKSARNFQYIHWESVLIKDCNTSNGNNVPWGNAASGNHWAASHEYAPEEKGWSEPFYSYTRWYRCYAHGVEGNTGWFYERHVYAIPLQATNVTARYEQLGEAGSTVIVEWNSPWSEAHPIDSVTVQYLITKPVCTVREEDGRMVMTISCPNTDSGWVSLKDVSGTQGKRSMSFSVPVAIDDDQCLFVRVNNKHDENVTYGEKVLVSNGLGKLQSPSISQITPGEIPNLYTVTVDRKTTISEAFIGVYLRTQEDPGMNALIGIIPASRNNTKLIIPDDISQNIDFGVKAFVANYTPISATSEDKPTYYTVTDIANVGRMESDTNWEGGAVPLPPVEISLLKTSDSTVQIGWNWSWRDANQAEISWADHKDAWESTDEPQTYIVNNTNAGRWTIAGLGVGTWYIRLRLLKVEGEATTYGTYSDIKEIKLSASPDTPSLLLSDGVIPKDGSVTCYWVYVSGDGTAQMQGEICEAFPEYIEVENPSGNPYEQMYYERIRLEIEEERYIYVRSTDTNVDPDKTYYTSTGRVSYSEQPLKTTASAQHITINAEEEGWQPGETHYLAARVFSASGESSNGWSAPVPLTIANSIKAEIVQHSFVEKEIPIDAGEGEEPVIRTDLSLTQFPITCKATGAGKGGITTYIIERAETYLMDRPDESEHRGFKGETIVKKNQNGEEPIEINQEDLIGFLDDGAIYRLIATVKDTYGQTDETSVEFYVHWNHQAIIPTAEISIDKEETVTFITPIKPEGWIEGDVCDIYRLSVDRPELIVENGSFDTKYVDPYPTLGDFGGHRVVYKTINGDYITEDNEPAWDDYDVESYPELKHDLFGIIIDFDGDRLELPYNIALSNSWKKGFTVTKYLGGSIQGDWDPGIERTVSASTAIPVEVTPDKIELLRKLATYPGVCHVRTPDGSSYSANIEVKDDREEKWTTRVSKVSLDITKIDSESTDGITYDEWVEQT